MKKRITTTAISVGLLLIIWEIIARIINHPELFPSVIQLLQTLFLQLISVSFYQSVGVTVLRGLTGITISVLAAIVFAFLFARNKWLYELFRPVLAIMRSIPVISFILLALIFLHVETIPLIIAFLVMFPLLTENLTKGMLNFRPGFNALSQAFLIKGRNRLFHIYYPQLKPFVFSGLASAMGFGWRAIIMGEVLAQSSFGIGSEMKRAQTFIDVPELLTWTMVAIIISFLFDKGISKLENLRPPLSFPIPKDRTTRKSGAFELSDVSFSYGKKDVLVNFSHTFEAGKMYGISAPSGKGKTTLLNIINGLLSPGKGALKGIPLKGTATVFQEPELLPHLSVPENILLPLSGIYDKKEALEITDNLLKKMELEACEELYPAQLSYGQQQRVAIARALAFPSPLLLMDEPFKGLDKELTEHIIAYIREKQTADRQTILFSTHKQEELHLLADEVISL